MRTLIALVLLCGIAATEAAAAPPSDELLARVRQRLKGTLRYGGDAEGGAPFTLRDPENPSRVIGFEVEIADGLAKRLGVKAEFVQYEWVSLVPGVQRGDFDVIINGFEMTEENRAELLFTRPYYLFTQQLVVRKNEDRIRRLEDCMPSDANPAGYQVATLSGSAAERLLQEKKIPILGFDGNIEPYLVLQMGSVDAVLLDGPIALYYASTNKRLKFIESPAEPFYYGIAVPKSGKGMKDGEETKEPTVAELELATALDWALGEMMESGELRRIYRKWHLWNERQPELVDPPEELRGPAYDEADKERLAGGMKPPQPGEEVPGDAVDIDIIAASARLWTFDKYFPELLKAALMTIFLSVTSMALAMVLGLLVCLARLYGPSWLRACALVYVEFFRGVPLLLLLFFLYFGVGYYLTTIDIEIAAWQWAIIGFGLNYAAYEAEIYRAAIQAVPVGQWEAAHALGMPSTLAFRRIIFPQAFRTALPSMTNDFVALFKDTSLVSVIAVRELTKEYLILSRSSLKFVELGILTAVLYLVMSVPLGYLSRWLEKKWGVT
jgi:polar amino acid transport system substrate-binding protein